MVRMEHPELAHQQSCDDEHQQQGSDDPQEKAHLLRA